MYLVASLHSCCFFCHFTVLLSLCATSFKFFSCTSALDLVLLPFIAPLHSRSYLYVSKYCPPLSIATDLVLSFPPSPPSDVIFFFKPFFKIISGKCNIFSLSHKQVSNGLVFLLCISCSLDKSYYQGLISISSHSGIAILNKLHVWT